MISILVISNNKTKQGWYNRYFLKTLLSPLFRIVTFFIFCLNYFITNMNIYRTLYSLISNLILNIQTGNSRTKDTSYMIFHYIYSKAKNRRKHKSSPFEKPYKWVILSNCDLLLFSICILHPTSKKYSFFNLRKFWMGAICIN